MKEKYPRWMFIIFPAITMLLGWGLRGHIGGGSFGAMIPGAMVALSLCLLLELPPASTSIIVVFGAVGIGIGGEMTYGQTLGFLNSPETMWWGTLGITVKGSIWGLLGGSVLAMGFIYKRLAHKTVIVAFLLMMFGMWIGFKLINQPKIIYFSNPVKPRSESWGALLLGAVALLTYLRYKINKADFKIIFRFAVLGLIGGGLGFGLGGFWRVYGEGFPMGILWWKLMEFTFGLLLGAALGYAAWLSRKELRSEIKEGSGFIAYPLKFIYKEFGITLLVALLLNWLIPLSLKSFLDVTSSIDGVLIGGLRNIAMIMRNYAFYGFILIIVSMYFPKVAWQLGITFTFCYTAIDLVYDNFSDAVANSPSGYFAMIFMTLLVALLTVYFHRRKGAAQSMLLLLVWSTVIISYLGFGFKLESSYFAGKSLYEIVCGYFIVDIIFTVSAIFVSWMAAKKIRMA